MVIKNPWEVANKSYNKDNMEEVNPEVEHIELEMNTKKEKIGAKKISVINVVGRCTCLKIVNLFR